KNSREINLSQHFGIADEAHADIGQGRREIKPRHEAGQVKYWWRQPVVRKVCQLPEQDSKHDHREQGLYYRPTNTEYSLLITNLYVTPGEEEAQFPIGVKLARDFSYLSVAWRTKDRRRQSNRPLLLRVLA